MKRRGADERSEEGEEVWRRGAKKVKGVGPDSGKYALRGLEGALSAGALTIVVRKERRFGFG